MRGRSIFRAGLTCVALLALPASAQVAPAEVQAGVAACADANFSWLDCARGIERQALPGVGVSRSPGVLTLQTARATVRLKDTFDATGFPTTVYTYLGPAKPLPHHLVLQLHEEQSSHWLIDAESGHIAQLPSFPVVAPGGRHAVVASEDLGAGFRPNVLEIWRVADGAIQREASFKPAWGPRAVRWVTAERVEVTKVCLQPTAPEPQLCGLASLTRRGGVWRLMD
ncbi:hypothetical protein [Roseateles sp. BYS87W]|uniref:Uncharacterized protein n=1 Tax=Pelomonas baiyunensis TaxID=3299026 RepID=A0ABW7GZ67_9BURK